MVLVGRKVKGVSSVSLLLRVLFMVPDKIRRSWSTLGDGVTFQPYVYPSVTSSGLTTVTRLPICNTCPIAPINGN